MYSTSSFRAARTSSAPRVAPEISSQNSGSCAQAVSGGSSSTVGPASNSAKQSALLNSSRSARRMAATNFGGYTATCCDRPLNTLP